MRLERPPLLAAIPANTAATGRTCAVQTAVTLLWALLISLCLHPSSSPAAPAVIWRGANGVSATTNWSDRVNWSAAPDGKEVVFTDEGSAPPGIVNNVIDRSLTVHSLSYRNLNCSHTTLLLPGVKLTIIGGLAAGAIGNPDILAVETNTITGDGGTLMLANALVVNQGSAQADSHNVVLDLSGLGRLIMDLGVPLGKSDYVNVGQDWGYYSTGDGWPCGTLYLAKTNILNVIPKIAIENLRPARMTPAPTVPSALYLGLVNTISLNEIDVGYANATNALLAFNPAFIPKTRAGQVPVAHFRAANGGLQPRIRLWLISYGEGPAIGAGTGTSDFSGGRVDILVDRVRIGVGGPGDRRTGVLTFDNGIIDANTIEAGTQTTADGGGGVGIVNVNSNATLGTSATLVVNTNLMLAQTAVSSNSGTAGILNINGGTVLANQIVTKGGSTARIAMNEGMLTVSNGFGALSKPISSLRMTNSALQLCVSTNNAGPLVFVNRLITGGATNRINIVSLPLLKSYPAKFQLIRYTTYREPFNFGLGTLPPSGYVGHLLYDPNTASVMLVITDGPAPWWTRQSVRAAAIAAILLVALAGYFLRVRSIERRNRELATLVTERTKLLSERSVQLEAVKNDVEAANRSLEERVTARTSELQAANAALRQAEEKYRHIFENAIDGIFQSSPSGKLLAANPALARMLGFASPAELMEMVRDARTQLYVKPERRSEFIQLLEEHNLATGFEVQSYRKDGSVIWVSMNARMVRDPDGKPLYYEGTVEDITQRKQLEDQLRQSQKMEAFGQLAAGVAHDFNNILTVIQGNLSLLRLPALSETERQTAMRYASEAGERAANLTRQLLLFSRHQRLSPKDLDLNEVVNSVTKMLQRLIGEHIALETHYAPGGALVHADPGMMEQVLLNLAINSRDAMPNGGRLIVETAAVMVDENHTHSQPRARPGEYIRLAVTDTGTGISPEHFPHIFEPFFTTKEVGKGTGLGLATVFGIVEQHQGWIEVESKVNVGTTFYIYLPRLAAIAPAHLESPAVLSAPRGNETILLVEDEAAVRSLMQSLLERHGYRVHVAESAAAAVKLWPEHRAGINLLITDIITPGGISGCELADRLRADKPGLKVVYCSGHTDEVLGKDSPLRDNPNFLNKPFELHKFLQQVRACLDAR